MAVFDRTEQNLRKNGTKWQKMLPLTVVAVLAVLATASTLTFYQYMDKTFFKERSSHFIEISDTVTQVIESAVLHYRTAAHTAEAMLEDADTQTESAAKAALAEIQEKLGTDNGTVVAFDSSAWFYASDGSTGRWQETEMLSNGEEMQTVVTPLDYREDGKSYILFVKKLDMQKSEGIALTHIGVVVDLSVFQKTFDAELFQNRSHVYVVNPDGYSLYRHECAGGFIDDYDILGTLKKDCEFIHGGTTESLHRNLQERTSAGYEFYFGEERYFVAASPVRQTDWAVLTFVPTEVLSAGTTSFLNMAVVYVSVIASMVVLMMGLLMFFFISKRGDRRIIAHQRQANALLKDAADAANAASIAKSDFLSHMSHDIRTPINGIMGMTEIALKNIDDKDRVLDCLQKIDGSSGHLLSLVNDVLDMSRIESGKVQISHKPLNILELLRHCSSIISGQLQGRDIMFTEEFENIENPHILGDELHLRQVLINILGNAVKFTPDGGRIYFRVREFSAEGEAARFHIEIEDTGIGMKPEFLPHIFEPFAQEDGGNRSSYKGTGLGMSITKKFMDLMGGIVEVQSEPGKGTLFRLELPVEIDREWQGEQESAGQQTTLAGARVILAEDNDLNMEIAVFMLESLEIEVTAVTDGKAALDAFAAAAPGTFDGILMDVMMPVMDGLTATREIRALEREDAGVIPIIAMTANAYDEDRRKCMEAGMDAHMSKPIDGEVLRKMLVQYICVERHT
ncbi:MAG: response regulator [Anaerotignum sp.]|nr:response regulator [Anaerotignum sp.]